MIKSRARRSKAGSTLKWGLPSACLITSSHRLATLNAGVSSGGQQPQAGLRVASFHLGRVRSPWQVLTYYTVSDEGTAWVGF